VLYEGGIVTGGGKGGGIDLATPGRKKGSQKKRIAIFAYNPGKKKEANAKSRGENPCLRGAGE